MTATRNGSAKQNGRPRPLPPVFSQGRGARVTFYGAEIGETPLLG